MGAYSRGALIREWALIRAFTVIQLKTRGLYKVIETSKSWDSRISLAQFPKAVCELIFWKNNFNKYNVKSRNKGYTPALKCYSDASDTGLAAHVNIKGEEKIVYKNFSETESLRSSTWRELFAIEFALCSLKHHLTVCVIQWNTDNYAATRIFKSGSSKEWLQEISENIFQLCK